MRAALLLILLSATTWAGEAFGVGELNPTRSTLAGGQKSVTLRIERDNQSSRQVDSRTLEILRRSENGGRLKK